jgi:hypothetical protein
MAETIPFVAPETAYLEQISNGKNAFVIKQPSDIMNLVKKLNNDRRYLESIRQNIQEISASMNTEKIVCMYDKEFLKLISDPNTFGFLRRIFLLIKAFSKSELFKLSLKIRNVKMLSFLFKIRFRIIRD